MVVDWVWLTFHFLPGCSWADGSLAEFAVQLGNKVKHSNQSQPNPSPRPPGPPCCIEENMHNGSLHDGGGGGDGVPGSSLHGTRRAGR